MQLPEDEILEEKERNLEFENNNDTNDETNNEIKKIRQEILGEKMCIRDREYIQQEILETEQHLKWKETYLEQQNSNT